MPRSASSQIARCPWAGDDGPMAAYHDEEWGVPVLDETDLFAKLILDSAQAGLSWSTILARRDGYRAAFWNWDLERIAAASEQDREALLADARIIRNRRKIDATITNAAVTLRLHDEGRSLTQIVWAYAEPSARRSAMAEVPAQTDASRALSRELKRLGFRFVGPTICYAFMQACGIVNDHLVACPRHDPVEALRTAAMAHTQSG